MRVLQNQQRIAVELAQAHQQQRGGQMQMPLIVEVTGGHPPKRSSRPARRTRRAASQSVHDEI
jgi:hypothetical protein